MDTWCPKGVIRELHALRKLRDVPPNVCNCSSYFFTVPSGASPSQALAASISVASK